MYKNILIIRLKFSIFLCLILTLLCMYKINMKNFSKKKHNIMLNEKYLVIE